MDEFKKQYRKVAKLTRERHLEGAKLDRMIERRWGFKFSDTDDDQMIDTLDYGTDCLSATEFIEKMNQYKENLDKSGRFR
jgi:hypothetical protein